MRNKILATLIGAFIGITSFSQQSETNPLLEIEHVSSNTLSSTISVHTYHLMNVGTPTQLNDSLPATTFSSDIQTIIDTFSSVEGVIRCTFDNATQTFTIVANPITDLSYTAQQFQTH